MPSLTHEAWLLPFRDRPTLAAELIEGSLGVPLPSHEEASIESAELTQVTPIEYRADLVLALRHRDSELPVAAIVLEAQLQPDVGKRYVWPTYLVNLRARWKCPVSLLVVTPSPKVAQWCRRPIDLGHPNLIFTPLVLGPEAVPIIRDPEEAQRAPELAVLSAMAHGQGDPDTAQEIALAAIAAMANLPRDQAVLYLDLIFATLGEAAKNAVEALVRSTTYTYQSDFAKRYYNQGLGVGEAQALLVVLESRGLTPDPAQRERIMSAERGEIEAWLRRAVTTESIRSLLES